MATIAENLQTIIDIKADIKTAIENKGVTVGDAGFGEYASKIDSIEGSGSTSDIILPRQFRIAYSGADGEEFNSSSYWQWPANIKFAQTPFWAHAFAYVKNVENLPAISTVYPTDLYYTTDFSYMFAGAKFSITYNMVFWNSLDYSNAAYINHMFESASLSSFDSFKCNSTVLKDISYLFYYYKDSNYHLPSIEFDDLTKVEKIYGAFYPSQMHDIDILRLPNLGLGFTGTSSSKHELDLSRLEFNNISALVTTFNDLGVVTVTDAIIKLNTATYDLLSADDIAIATSKGWIVESA